MEEFEGKVHNFMVSNVESFNNLTREEALPLRLCPKNTDLYGDPLPLELLMQVPTSARQNSLFKLIGPGDIVRGHVVIKTSVALGVRVTSLVGSWKVRGLVDLDVWGLIPVECLASDKDKCECILEDMQEDDVVQAVVTGSKETQLSLSFRMRDVSLFCPSGSLPEGVVLGYLEDERPQHAEDSCDDSSFLLDLKSSPGFANPSSTENLKEALGICGYNSQTKPTLILDMQNKIYLESDFSSALRKQQHFKWSMQTVAIGVKDFKAGDLDKALTIFHHALDIDPSNVEGLVARGALYANRNRFRKAIADFEAALTENCHHGNARKYLVETRMAYAEELEETGHLEEAADCYRETLADDASHASAKEKLKKINELLKRQADERLERERKEAAERARIKKLHSIIEEERKRKEQKEVFTVELKSDKKKHKKRKKKSYKKNKKWQHHSSDEESLISSDMDSPRSCSPVRKRHRKSHRRLGEERQESRSRDHRRHHPPARHHSPTRHRGRTSSCSPLVRDKMRDSVNPHSPSSSASPGRRRFQEDSRSHLSSSKSSSRQLYKSSSPSPKRKQKSEHRGGRNGRSRGDHSRSPSSSPQRRRRSRGRQRSRRPSSSRWRHSSSSTRDIRTASPDSRGRKDYRYKAEQQKVHSKSSSSHHHDYHRRKS